MNKTETFLAGEFQRQIISLRKTIKEIAELSDILNTPSAKDALESGCFRKEHIIDFVDRFYKIEELCKEVGDE